MSARPATHQVLAAGTIIGERYRVESVIGEGAQSVVYLARRVSDGARVALKIIHRHLCGDPHLSRRFQREAEILSRLEGEHVVRLLDFVEDDGLFAIALEYVVGTPLENLLAGGAPLDIPLALEIALQICAALGPAHARGIIHRDLKPANVLVERASHEGPLSASGVRVKVVDFGLGKMLHGESTTKLTELGMIFGTPEYMAPEQARGDEVDARADLYAAGVILYQMVVGEPPFSGRNALGTMSAHLAEAPRTPRAARPSSEITPSLEAVILRAIAKDPAERYQTARELAEAISAVRDETRVIAPRAVSNPDLLGASDTDLHVPLPVLEQARTLRADEVAAAQARIEAAGAPAVIEVPGNARGLRPDKPGYAPEPPVVRVRPSEIPVTVPSPKQAAPLKKVERPRVESEILDEPTAVSGEPPPRSNWIWAIVAVIAATVGVVIGVLAAR
jgi:serine/threonine-protein kinase